MEVVELKKSPNKDAIDVLEEVLVRARAGELASVAISWVSSSGGIGGCNSSGSDIFHTWAAMEHHSRSFYTNIVCEDD